jgi:hypothetical protein
MILITHDILVNVLIEHFNLSFYLNSLFIPSFLSPFTIAATIYTVHITITILNYTISLTNPNFL